MWKLASDLQERLDRVPKGLREHIQRVRRIAIELAEAHDLDSRQADAGAAAHDIMRAESRDALLAAAKGYGIDVLPVEENAPVLLHGPVAAEWLERSGLGLPAEVVEAVRWHTTGVAGMGPIAKVVLLADKLDPEKARKYPYQEEVHGIALQSLDRAVAEFLGREMEGFLRRGFAIHPRMVEARNALVLSLGRS